jgi:hypothetical protein
MMLIIGVMGGERTNALMICTNANALMTPQSSLGLGWVWGLGFRVLGFGFRV